MSLLFSRNRWTIRNDFSSGQFTCILYGVGVILADTFSSPSILYNSLATRCHGLQGRVITKMGGTRVVGGSETWLLIDVVDWLSRIMSEADSESDLVSIEDSSSFDVNRGPMVEDDLERGGEMSFA